MTLRLTRAEYDYLIGRLSGRAKPPKVGITVKPASYVAVGSDGALTVHLPISLVNSSNERSGWWTKAKRAKAQRRMVKAVLHGARLPPLPVVVTIERRATRLCDDDGLCISGKSVRDAIASDCYGVDDASPLYTWRYTQQKAKTNSCVITICSANHALPREEER